MTRMTTDPFARRRQRQRDEFERTCAEMAAKGYSWRYVADATGATPDECRRAALCHAQRRERV